MKKNVYFVSGMDTGIGKSYATGFLAREWNARGIRKPCATVSREQRLFSFAGFGEKSWE